MKMLQQAVLLLLMLVASVHCDIDVALSAAEYYRLTGSWRLEGVMLIKDGVTTDERLIVPECVHTVTMQWYSVHYLDHLQYTIAKIHSSEPAVLPIVQVSVPWWGILPLSTDTISLEFRCNGSGEARVDVTVAVSNRSHYGYHNDIATYHVFSLTKRCGDCHSNGGMPGRSCDHLQCINNGQCVNFGNHTEVCVCPPGYHGKHCERAWCHPNCENGGYCVKPDKCICPKGYTGSRCHKATCYPECKNGGTCVKVGVCQCVPPYFGARCEQRGHIQFIHKPQGRVCVEPSYTAMLKCDVMATPNARITWWKGRKKISKANHHYLMLHNVTDNVVSSILLIYDTSTTDNGWYTCLASNSAVSRRTHAYVAVTQCGEVYSGDNGIDDDDDDDDDMDGNDDNDNNNSNGNDFP